MSYSRWGESRWYTYWASYCEKFSRDEQEFVVCTVGDATYGEMVTDFEAVVKWLVARCIEEREHPPLSGEIEELRGYMREFMADVEARDA